jgi:hypothetical protein
MLELPSEKVGKLVCPARGTEAHREPVERNGKFGLFACQACDLYHWYLRMMPDATWYEQMYGGRDTSLLPLEPGHKYLLSDPTVPK